eukprot:1140702-Pelagomonas_calceolata.AAC.4
MCCLTALIGSCLSNALLPVVLLLATPQGGRAGRGRNRALRVAALHCGQGFCGRLAGHASCAGGGVRDDHFCCLGTTCSTSTDLGTYMSACLRVCTCMCARACVLISLLGMCRTTLESQNALCLNVSLDWVRSPCMHA